MKLLFVEEAFWYHPAIGVAVCLYMHQRLSLHSAVSSSGHELIVLKGLLIDHGVSAHRVVENCSRGRQCPP